MDKYNKNDQICKHRWHSNFHIPNNNLDADSIHHSSTIENIQYGRIQPRAIRNMLHIIKEFNQLQNLIIPLSDDYAQNIGIHICKINHRDVICCENAELLHNGTSPSITIVYIPSNLEKRRKNNHKSSTRAFSKPKWK